MGIYTYGNVNTDGVWGSYISCKKVKWQTLETLGRRKYLWGTKDERSWVREDIIVSFNSIQVHIHSPLFRHSLKKEDLVDDKFSQSFAYKLNALLPLKLTLIHATHFKDNSPVLRLNFTAHSIISSPPFIRKLYSAHYELNVNATFTITVISP